MVAKKSALYFLKYSEEEHETYGPLTEDEVQDCIADFYSDSSGGDISPVVWEVSAQKTADVRLVVTIT